MVDPEPYLTPQDLRDRWKILRDEIDTEDADLVARLDLILAALVSGFEVGAERYRGVAYRRREATRIVRGHQHRSMLFLPWVEVAQLTAVTIDGRQLGADELAELNEDLDPAGIVERRGGWGRRARVVVEHGLDEPPPLALEACAEYCRYHAVAAIVEDGASNAISYTDPNTGWVTRESTADEAAGRPTGILVVDGFLNMLTDHRAPRLW